MRYWSFVERKIQDFRRITSAQIIHHTGIEDTLRCFEFKEDEIHAKKLVCDAMYMGKCATADALLSKDKISREY